MKKMTMVTIQMFTESRLDPIVVPLQGNNQTENLISGLILGTMSATTWRCYAAWTRPPVPVIAEFKERIGMSWR